METKISGLALHCHHDILCEYVHDYDDRVAFIKEHKPLKEQKLRLRLLQIVPDERVPGRNSLEYKAYVLAWEACNEAWKTGKAVDVDEAWGAYAGARKAYIRAFRAEIEKLHDELCPDCPWDGYTIFSEIT